MSESYESEWRKGVTDGLSSLNAKVDSLARDLNDARLTTATLTKMDALEHKVDTERERRQIVCDELQKDVTRAKAAFETLKYVFITINALVVIGLTILIMIRTK